MSQWTHVAGMIRYDGFQAMISEGVEARLTHFFGKIDRFDSEERYCDLPCGSEGSLEYRVWINPDANHMACAHVAVWGDLRDFGEEDVPMIVHWFKRKVRAEELNLIPREAVLAIDVEGSPKRVLILDTSDIRKIGVKVLEE